MSFTHLDGDSFCVGTLYDPAKIAEFDSSHSKTEGSVPYMSKNLTIYTHTKDADYLLESTPLPFFPHGGFYHLNQEDRHIIMVSGWVFGIVRSWKIEYPDNITNENNQVPVTIRLYSGILHDDIFFPALSGSFCDETSVSGTYIVEENYPKPTEALKAEYGLYNHLLWHWPPLSPVFWPSEIIAADWHKLNVDTTLQSIAMAKTFSINSGCTIQYPIRANAVISIGDNITLNDLMSSQYRDWVRPLIFAQTFFGLEGTRYLFPRISNYVYHGGPWGLIPIFGPSHYSIEIIRKFYNRVSNISSLCMSPAANNTRLASGKGTFDRILMPFMYPTYPYINLLTSEFATLTLYTNLPDGADDYYLYPEPDWPNPVHIPPLQWLFYHHTMFPEEFTLFEGFMAGKSLATEIEHERDGNYFFYATKSKVPLDTFDITIDKVNGDTAGCTCIVPHPRGINSGWDSYEDIYLSLSRSAMDEYMYFADAKLNQCNVILPTSFKLPILLSISSSKILDKLNQKLLDKLNKLISNSEVLSELTLPIWSVVTVAEGASKDFHPLRSLVGIPPDYYVFHSDMHFAMKQSKSGFYATTVTEPTPQEMYIIMYTATVDNNNVSQLLSKVRKIEGSYIEGDFLNGYTQYDKHGDKIQTIDIPVIHIATTCPEVKDTIRFNDIGVFPYLVELSDNVFITHTPTHLIKYTVKDNQIVNRTEYPLPFRNPASRIAATDLLELEKSY